MSFFGAVVSQSRKKKTNILTINKHSPYYMDFIIVLYWTSIREVNVC